MAFSTLTFICIFLPAMLAGYYILPKRVRNIWLLLGSLFFYGWNDPKYLPIILISILINFFAALIIARMSATDNVTGTPNNTYNKMYGLSEGALHTNGQKAVLVITLVINLASLIYFKYTTMILETINDIRGNEAELPEILLPLGISFFTFQSISYLLDVYRMEGSVDKDGNKVSIVEKNFIDYALYITMFPQLLQGPIERYPKMKSALKSPELSMSKFTAGLERFIVGLAKKAIIADTLGQAADLIFECDPLMMGTSVSWLGAILYTLQIYFDFSGYSDMAIGLGNLFGFEFTENFNYPYVSKSVTEFWRRWHISLSNWFRDYLYIPLGGNKKGNVYLNLLVVFLATGIWHGAAWGFLVWGLWHGLFMLIERALKGKTSFKLPGIFKWMYTMLAVSLGWVLFRIEDLEVAMDYFTTMFHIGTHEYNAFALSYYLDKKLIFMLIVAVIAAIPWAELLPRYPGVYIAKFVDTKEGILCVIRRVILLALFVLTLIFIVNSTYSPFIYFKF